MKVEIRPIEREKWHGKKKVENFAQPVVVEAMFNVSTGKLETGLTDEEQKSYSEKTGLNLDPRINNGEPHPYYGSKKGWLVLPQNTMILDDENPLEYIKIKLAKASKYVANSLKDYEEGLYPEATHVIYDEKEEVAKKASKIAIKNQAIQIALKMSYDEKLNMVQVIENKNLKGKSNDFIDIAINDIIDTEPTEFIRFAKMGKEQVYNRALILEGIQKNILTKEGNSILYMGELIGYSYEDVVNYFADPQNQKIKIAILEKITNK